MTEIYIATGGTVYTGPVGGDGPWTELGHTTEGVCVYAPVIFDGDPEFDPDALLRGFGGGTVTTTFTMNRRRFRRLYRIMTGYRYHPPRNRRRNPLYGVRDRLRRAARGRGHR